MVVRRPRAPDRGDIVWITLADQTGHEQAGRRPAVVLSPAAYNAKVGLALMCPVTSRIKGYPFEVTIPPGLRVSGVVLAEQVKSLEWLVRRSERICALPSPAVVGGLRKLGALLS